MQSATFCCTALAVCQLVLALRPLVQPAPRAKGGHACREGVRFNSSVSRQRVVRLDADKLAVEWQQQAATRMSCSAKYPLAVHTTAAVHAPDDADSPEPENTTMRWLLPASSSSCSRPASASSSLRRRVGGCRRERRRQRRRCEQCAGRASSGHLGSLAACGSGGRTLPHLEAATRRLFFLSVILGPPDSSLIALQVLANPDRVRKVRPECLLGSGAGADGFPGGDAFSQWVAGELNVLHSFACSSLAHHISRPCKCQGGPAGPGSDPSACGVNFAN